MEGVNLPKLYVVLSNQPILNCHCVLHTEKILLRLDSVNIYVVGNEPEFSVSFKTNVNSGLKKVASQENCFYIY